MTEFDYTEIKGHILKEITIRMDFHDIIKVSDDSRKKIYKECFQKNLYNSLTRTLTTYDFQYSDYITDIRPSYSYLSRINSHVFTNDEQNLIVEINQFYLKITQEVNGDYIRFSEMKELYMTLSDILQQNDDIKIKRFSLNKVNEVFYKDQKNLLVDFKENIIGLNDYGVNVEWLHPNTQMNQTLNFQSDEFFVNISKVIDNGVINNDVLIRLLLQFEIFIIDEIDKSPSDLLPVMNEKMNKLFFGCLSDEGLTKIKQDRLGDIQYD